MQTKQNDMSPGDAQAALAWLIEMGADEIVGEAPVNRFAAVMVAPPVVAAAVSKAGTGPLRPLHRQRPAIRWLSFKRHCLHWKIFR